MTRITRYINKRGTWQEQAEQQTKERHTKFQLIELLDTDHKTRKFTMFKIIKKETPLLVSVE